MSTEVDVELLDKLVTPETLHLIIEFETGKEAMKLPEEIRSLENAGKPPGWGGRSAIARTKRGTHEYHWFAGKRAVVWIFISQGPAAAKAAFNTVKPLWDDTEAANAVDTTTEAVKNEPISDSLADCEWPDDEMVPEWIGMTLREIIADSAVAILQKQIIKQIMPPGH